jgi:hypothetical protein
MYALKVTSNYHVPLNYHSGNEGSSIHKGMSPEFKDLGNFRLIIPGAGEVNIIDLGARHIANFSKAPSGVFLSYQGRECEFRYEGGGQIQLNVTDLGQVELSGNGSFVQTDLPSFVLKKTH